MQRLLWGGRSRIAAAALLVLFGASTAEAAQARGGSAPAHARGGSAPVHAAGHASYGHYSHHHHGYYGGYYGYGWGYGWPYYGYWGYPWGYGGYWDGPRVYVVPGAVDSNAPGALETDVTPGKAEVWIDAAPVGQARDFNGRWDLLWLPPGRHRIEFRREGYMTLSQLIEVDPGSRQVVEARLTQGTGLDPRSTPEGENETAPPQEARPDTVGSPLPQGFLRVTVEPADAAVYLDGEFFAHGDELARLHGAIPLAVGRHRVEVVRPGFAAKSVDVEISTDEATRLEIELEPAS
jgi:hypothetical protein